MPVFATFSSKGRAISTSQVDAAEDEMNIAFMDIGQGDCTIISCPDNEVIVLDCGTVGNLPGTGLDPMQQLVRDWADGENIDLILTHPDRDHYNKVIDLCNVVPAVHVNNIYFSRAYSDASPLGNYYVTALGGNMHIFNFPYLFEITLNANTHSGKRWTNNNGYNAPGAPFDIPLTGRVVKEGTTEDGTNWSVKIIAGNVPAFGGADVQSNAASLVTLIQFGAEKVLMMADSTVETMNYLRQHQAAQIANVNIFQMPHHGSENNLPPANFRTLVNPFAIMISVGLFSNNFKLPRQNAINAWRNGTNLIHANLVLDYWELGAMGYDDNDDLNRILDEEWDDYIWDSNNSNSFFYLTDPNDAGPGEANTGFYGFTRNGYFLYRVTIDRDIWSTGVEGTYNQDFSE